METLTRCTAVIDQQDDRVVGHSSVEDLARLSAFGDHEIVGPQIHDEPVTRVGHRDERSPAVGDLLLGGAAGRGENPK